MACAANRENNTVSLVQCLTLPENLEDREADGCILDGPWFHGGDLPLIEDHVPVPEPEPQETCLICLEEFDHVPIRPCNKNARCKNPICDSCFAEMGVKTLYRQCNCHACSHMPPKRVVQVTPSCMYCREPTLRRQ